METIRFPLQRR